MKTVVKHRFPHVFLANRPIFITAKTYGSIPYLQLPTRKDYFWKLLEEKGIVYRVNLEGRVVLDNHYHLIISSPDVKNIPKFIKGLHGASANKIKKSFPKEPVVGGQVLVRKHTSWDERQITRLTNELEELKGRKLPARQSPVKTSTRGLKSAKTSYPPSVLARFIARHQEMFDPKSYREIVKAINQGKIFDPQTLILMISKDYPIWHQYYDHVIRDEVDYFRHLNYIHQNPVKHGITTKMSAYSWSSIHQYVRENGKDWVVDCFRQYPVIDFQPEGIAD